MQIEHKDLDSAVNEGLLTSAQAKQLWQFFEKKKEHVPQFRFSHVLYYFGGLLAISAVTLFVTQAWNRLIGVPLFLLSALLFALGLLFTHHFLKKQLYIPAGIMATFSLALVPLAVYNIQIGLGYLPDQHYNYADFHTYINWYWVPMEVATLIAGAILFYFYRFPFLLFPIAIVLWYLSMDLWSLLIHKGDMAFEQRAAFSMYFGLIMVLLTIFIDFKFDNPEKDYPFWLYIFGVLIFWGGLSMQQSDSELSKFFYCLLNVFMIFVSVFLNRRVFAIFGVIGTLGYLGHLAFSIFKDSLSFPLVLVAFGLIIIFIAAKWPALERKLFTYFRPYIPEKVLKRMQS